MDMPQPPRDHELERQLLASLLQHPETAEVCGMAASVNRDIFDLPGHRKLFDDIRAVTDDDENPDKLAFGDNKLARELFAIPPLMPYQFETARRELEGKAIRRKAIEGAYELITVAHTAGEASDAVRMAGDVAKGLENAMSGTAKPRTTAEQLHIAITEVHAACKGIIPANVPYCLDFMKVATHYRGQVHAIGAYPGKGKTTLALQAFCHQAMMGYKVAYFVLESDAVEMCKRMLAYRAELPVQALLDGIKTDHGLVRFDKAFEEVNRARRNMFLRGPDEWDGTIEGMETACKKIKQDIGGLDAVYLDYLQDCQVPKSLRLKSQFEEVGYNAKRFKRAVSELDVAGVMLSQFSRESAREKKQPAMKDFRGSGEIEHCCHLMSCLHRDGEDAQAEAAQRLETWWYSVKTRLVQHWKVRLLFEGGKGRYVCGGM